MDFVDYLLPRQHVVVGVDLWRLPHGCTLRLNQGAPSADEARPSKGPLVEIFTIQGIGVSGVSPMMVKFSDHCAAREGTLPVAGYRRHAKSIAQRDVADFQRLLQVLDRGDELLHGGNNI